MGDLSAHFDRREFACPCGCGFDTVDAELIKVLEDLRLKLRHEITINSGCRCAKHNRAIGGVVNSQHLRGKAADIKVAHVPAYTVQACLDDIHPDKYGIGRYDDFTHIDVREARARW